MYLVGYVFLFFSISISAQQVLPTNQVNHVQVQEKAKEFKEIKLMGNESVCIFTESEQQEANEFNLEARESSFSKMASISLNLAKLRVLNGKSFDEILCALRLFTEQFRPTVGGSYHQYGSEEQKLLFQEYTKVLIKLSKDSKYKQDYEQKLKNSIDSGVYLKSILIDFNILMDHDLELAKKIFESGLKNRSHFSDFDKSLSLIFQMYYKKNVKIPSDMKDFLLSNSSNILGTGGFFDVYFTYVDDLSYEDLFKRMLEMNYTDKMGFRFKEQVKNSYFVRNMFESKYVPDQLKCNMGKEYFSLKLSEPDDFILKELSKSTLECIKKFINLSKNFEYPNNKCPQIKFENENQRQEVLQFMGESFYQNWLSCRVRCNPDDKCVALQSGALQKIFINKKYIDDKDIIISSRVKNQFAVSSEILSAENSKGECVRYNCTEKVKNCSLNGITEQLEEELLNANMKSCKADSDCRSVFVNFNCKELATNKNGSLAGNTWISGRKLTKDYGENIVTNRFIELSNICQINNINTFKNCEEKMKNESLTISKCVSNVCQITDQVALEVKAK